MNTPGHLLLGAALFARPAKRSYLWAAIAGSLAPDASLYVLVFWAINVTGISPQIVFSEMYFSESWQTIFAIDNSLILWGGALALAIWFRVNLVRIFAAAGTVHIALDFLLHHDDGRAHFWPITTWKFESPVSYWDSAHFGREAGIALFAVSIVSIGVLWSRFKARSARAVLIVLFALEAWVGLSWFRYF